MGDDFTVRRDEDERLKNILSGTVSTETIFFASLHKTYYTKVISNVFIYTRISVTSTRIFKLNKIRCADITSINVGPALFAESSRVPPL